MYVQFGNRVLPVKVAFEFHYLHSRLLERAAKLSTALGEGSMTSLPCFLPFFFSFKFRALLKSFSFMPLHAKSTISPLSPSLNAT